SFPRSLNFECEDVDWREQQQYCRQVYPLCKRIPRKNMTLEAVAEVWKILQRAHRVGLVHCDVRTPNVALNSDSGEVILLDWSSTRYHAAPQFVDEELRHEHASSFAARNAELGAKRHMGLIVAS